MYTADNITNEDLYAFYANRNLMNYSTCAATIHSDLKRELSLSYKDAVSSYLTMINHHVSLFDKNGKKKHSKLPIDTSSYLQYTRMITDRNLLDQYREISTYKGRVMKSIYRCSYDNYIFYFVNEHDSILPDSILTQIFSTIARTTYCQNPTINTYIKKILILKMFESMGADAVLYYNYKRFLYLYQKIVEYKLLPVYYNKHTGMFYFDVSFNEKHRKEQIFDRLRANDNRFGRISVEEVPLYIATSSGEVMYLKSTTSRSRKLVTEDSLSLLVPNVIRRSIHMIMDKKDPDSTLGNDTVRTLIGKVMRKYSSPIEYCKRDDPYGIMLTIPSFTNEWYQSPIGTLDILSRLKINTKYAIESHMPLVNQVAQSVVS